MNIHPLPCETRMAVCVRFVLEFLSFGLLERMPWVEGLAASRCCLFRVRRSARGRRKAAAGRCCVFWSSTVSGWTFVSCDLFSSSVGFSHRAPVIGFGVAAWFVRVFSRSAFENFVAYMLPRPPLCCCLHGISVCVFTSGVAVVQKVGPMCALGVPSDWAGLY